MKRWTWKRRIWLLCGLLLALPVAQAKKPHGENNERQTMERAPPMRGGYLEKDHDNRDQGPQYDERHSTPQYERHYAPQPRYDDGYNHDRRDQYDRGDEHGDERDYDHGYNQAPHYEPVPRYAPRGLNLSEAVNEAERRTGGRVLSAEPVDEGGQLFYRVKVLTPNGRIQVLFLDAQ